MDPGSEKPLRLFVNWFAIWTDLAFKTGEAMLVSAQAAALRANAAVPRASAPKVAVVPTADAPTPKTQAKPVDAMLASAHAAALRNAKVAVIPTAEALQQAKPAPKAMRFKAARAKLRSKANAKRRAKR